MAPPARKISKQEWNRHKDTIHDLYHIRGLPLCKKGEGDSVQKIMHEKHNFTASRAQFEVHVKSLDQPKKLKKEEWRAVHIRLSELLAMKIEARVKLSGKFLTDKQLQRNKRHAFSGHEHSHQSSSDGHALPRPNSLVIETRGANGEWSIYTSENTVVGTNSSPPASDLAILEREEPVLVARLEDNAVCQSGLDVLSQSQDLATNEHPIQVLERPPSLEYIDEYQGRFLINHQSQRFVLPSWALHDPYAFPNLDLPVEIGEFPCPDLGHLQLPEEYLNNLPELSTFEDSFIPQYWSQESPFSQLQTAVLATPPRSSHSETQSLQYSGADDDRETALGGLSESSPMSLVQSLLQNATNVLFSNSMPDEVQRLPDPDDVLDSLLSLLPKNIQQDGSGGTREIATKNTTVDSPFYNALLYSMVNGFAGLRNIPSGAILKMLKKQHHMNSRIIECLRSCPPAQAKCLADNLFRAAVEACDEETVIFILQATRNSPNAIDPNEITCKLDSKGRLYTPIELAAKFRHLGIVKILLAANADVNKTYDQDDRQEHGALELAVRKWGKFEAVDMTLVRTILDCYAEVRVTLIEAVIRWGQADLIYELISRLPPANHSKCFQNSNMLVEIAGFLGNDLATYIIKQIFEYCQSENCMRCSADHQQLMERTLCSAGKRANFKLVELLLPHTTMKDGGLTAAVRNGSRELIDLFFLHGASVGGPACYLDAIGLSKNGASVGGPVCYLDKMASFKDGLNFYPPTTPLAEAIRLQDKGLVHEFENLGALSHMDQNKHFEAAIFATAEIGDCHYMKMLLQHVPKKHRKDLTSALNVAIRNDRTEAALVLLNNGADVNEKNFCPGPGPALIEALQKQNKAIVDAILEADVDVNAHTRFGELDKTVMDPAGLWGDMSVVQDLILMGADVDAGRHTTALTAAVKSRNKDLVKLLLESGASPSARASLGATPLATAIENEDDDMIQLLISCGADPANEDAFISAIEKNREIFDTLLRAFSSRYPDGKLAFGETLLIRAVERGDATLLNRLLTAKFDINSFSKRKSFLLTALGFAIMYGKRAAKNLPVIQQLINHGDTNSIVMKSYDGSKNFQKTALLVAVETRSEHMVKLLLKGGADVHRPARRGLKRTPLQRACEIGSFKIVELLLEHNANVNEEPADRGGATALQLAAISGSIKIAELLLSHKAKVHAAPAKVRGRTAFEGAARYGCMEMLRVLWDAVAGRGFTPEQIEKAKNLALRKGHRGCAEYIDYLSSTISFPLLETNPLMGFEI